MKTYRKIHWNFIQFSADIESRQVQGIERNQEPFNLLSSKDSPSFVDFISSIIWREFIDNAENSLENAICGWEINVYRVESFSNFHFHLRNFPISSPMCNQI